MVAGVFIMYFDHSIIFFPWWIKLRREGGGVLILRVYNPKGAFLRPFNPFFKTIFSLFSFPLLHVFPYTFIFNFFPPEVPVLKRHGSIFCHVVYLQKFSNNHHFQFTNMICYCRAHPATWSSWPHHGRRRRSTLLCLCYIRLIVTRCCCLSRTYLQSLSVLTKDTT